MTDFPRLIEYAFPLKQTSLDSVHEKNVRHGHISTLHIWPARRPLAACRAALIATLLPDPSAQPKPEGMSDPQWQQEIVRRRQELCEKIAGRVVKRIERKKMPGGQTVERVKEETRDLMLLVGPSRVDKIEFEKGLGRWAWRSYWLDDANLPEKEGQLPADWRLGNRPDLTQMQAAAAALINDDVVKARLIEEIQKAKTLASGASALGVRVHTLDAQFAYGLTDEFQRDSKEG